MADVRTVDGMVRTNGAPTLASDIEYIRRFVKFAGTVAGPVMPPGHVCRSLVLVSRNMPLLSAQGVPTEVNVKFEHL